MKYRKDDLKNVFIRVLRNNKWIAIPLSETTHLEFKNWIADSLIAWDFTPNEIELPYILTDEDKVSALNKLSKIGININYFIF